MKVSFKPVVTLIAGRVLAFTFTFFIPIALVRAFDLASFGTYKQIFLVYMTLYGIAQLGMAESLYYFIPRHPTDGGKLAFNSVVSMAVAGLACLATLAVVAPSLARWLGNPQFIAYAAPIGILLFLMLMSSLLEIVMVSRKEYLRAAYTYALSDLVRSLLFILPGVLMKSVSWLLAGAIAFAALRLLYTLWYFRHTFRQEFTFDGAHLRRQLAYALPFELAIIAEILQSNYHQYAVSYHFGAVIFAVYSVGCLQLPFVDVVAGPTCNVMMVRMAEEIREGREKNVSAIWRETARKLGLVFIPLFVLLVVSAREIILMLFTERYAGAIPILMLWAGVVPLSILQTDGLLRVHAQTRFIFFLNLIRLGIIAGLIGWFLSTFGLAGAVLITLLATAVSKSLALGRAAGLMGITAKQVLPWRSLAATVAVSAAASLPVWIIKTQTHLPLLPLLLLMGSVYAASYLGLLLGFNLLNETEKRILTGWWHRVPVVKIREVEGS
jgi:O-antigen/teichoic acid export membrane protein